MTVKTDAWMAVLVASVACICWLLNRVDTELSAGPPLCGVLYQLVFSYFEVLGHGSSPLWQVSVSIPTAFTTSRFTTSRYRSCGRPVHLLPVASSPYSKSFGMRPSGMPWTWPSERSLRCLSKVNILNRPTRDKTFVFGTLSCHEIPRRLLMWKVFRRLSCLACVVHVSLPYSSVLMTQVL